MGINRDYCKLCGVPLGGEPAGTKEGYCEYCSPRTYEERKQEKRIHDLEEELDFLKDQFLKRK